MKQPKSFLLFFLLASLFAISAKADSWALPKEETVCSKNNKYCFKVIPKKLESQLSYFQDKVDGKENAGANKKIKENYSKGIYYVRDETGILRERWRTKLVNEVAPVDVLVSDRGDYVVTFDNWHSVGYGDNVVVIYEASKGALIKKLGLSDFLTDSDIENLPRSISSIWWGENHSIDKEKKQLLLEVTKGKRSFAENADYFTVRIELSTGKVLDEKRDRLPSLQFLIQPVEESPSENTTNISEGAREAACFEAKDFKKVSSAELLKKAVVQERPSYPAAAKAVRATGNVVVEILVSESGDVECARLVSGHPLLRRAVTEAVKKWKFEKGGAKSGGFIAFEGKVILISPDGKIIE